MTSAPTVQEGQLTLKQRSNYRIILVEPLHNENIGAVARAISNFGFSKLSLVNPIRYDRARAEVSACWGKNVLESVEIVDSLHAALSGSERIIAVSERSHKNGPPFILLSQLAEFLDESGGEQETALVFGREDRGLDKEELSACQVVVGLPTCEENPSLNLSQAVLLALYELSRSLPLLQDEVTQSEPRAIGAQRAQLENVAVELARSSGFFHHTSAPELPLLLANLFRRTELSKREADFLIGYFQSLRK